jgi:hypothetical protein
MDTMTSHQVKCLKAQMAATILGTLLPPNFAQRSHQGNEAATANQAKLEIDLAVALAEEIYKRTKD